MHCISGGILYHGAFHCRFLSFSNRVFASYEVWLSIACPAVALVLARSHLIYVQYCHSHCCASSFFGLARSFLDIHFWSGSNCLGSGAKMNLYLFQLPRISLHLFLTLTILAAYLLHESSASFPSGVGTTDSTRHQHFARHCHCPKVYSNRSHAYFVASKAKDRSATACVSDSP